MSIQTASAGAWVGHVHTDGSASALGLPVVRGGVEVGEGPGRDGAARSVVHRGYGAGSAGVAHDRTFIEYADALLAFTGRRGASRRVV
jgi:hypothetical protein